MVESKPPQQTRPKWIGGRLEAAVLLVAMLLASFIVRAWVTDPDENFEELALGRETQSYFAEVGGTPIHCLRAHEAGACIEGWEQRGRKPLAVWLGNSQLHAINQLRPGDQSASELVQAALSARGGDLLAFSQPNANLQEHYVLFLYLLERLPVRALVLPFVFDDTRESGLRPLIEAALEEPAVVASLEADATGRQILANYRKQASGDLAALDATVQQRSEETLNDWLEARSTLWRSRPAARGNLFNNLYIFRNQLLGIDAQSKRRVLPGRLALNLDAARSLLRAAREHKVETLLYIVPLRNDVATPYIASEYASFKQAIARLARDEGATLENLESLVPAELWGRKDATSLDGEAELDFMHFQGGGHALLAEAVLPKLLGMLGTPPR